MSREIGKFLCDDDNLHVCECVDKQRTHFQLWINNEQEEEVLTRISMLIAMILQFHLFLFLLRGALDNSRHATEAHQA